MCTKINTALILVVSMMTFVPPCLLQTPVEVESAATDSDTPNLYYFTCDDAYAFTVEIIDDEAWVFMPGRSVGISRVKSRTGEKYSNGHITLNITENAAELEIGRKTYKNCTGNAEYAIWEAARVRGVTFRAEGRDPDWHLELIEGISIEFTTVHNAVMFRFDAPAPEMNPEGTLITYNAKDGDHRLTIILDRSGCTGENDVIQLAYRVTVVHDGKEYRGCGMNLIQAAG